jgi:uncharacterized protein YacL
LPRWRKPDTGFLDGADLVDGLGFFDLDGVVGLIIGLAFAVLLVTGLIFFLLPLIAFLAELLALPFIVLFFRGTRIVEARNESTGERLRYRVHSRAEARDRERQLQRELGTAPHVQDAVRVLPPATS